VDTETTKDPITGYEMARPGPVGVTHGREMVIASDRAMGNARWLRLARALVALNISGWER
jgi:hypothetical protein